MDSGEWWEYYEKKRICWKKGTRSLWSPSISHVMSNELSGRLSFLSSLLRCRREQRSTRLRDNKYARVPQ